MGSFSLKYIFLLFLACLKCIGLIQSHNSICVQLKTREMKMQLYTWHKADFFNIYSTACLLIKGRCSVLRCTEVSTRCGADNFRLPEPNVVTWGAKAAALSNSYKVVHDRYLYLHTFPSIWASII